MFFYYLKINYFIYTMTNISHFLQTLNVDDIIKKIKDRIIKEFIQNTSIEEFIILKQKTL